MHATAIGVTSGNAVQGGLADALTMLNTSGVTKVAMACTIHEDYELKRTHLRTL